MNRMTKHTTEGRWYVEGAPEIWAEGCYGGAAVDRLAIFENVYEGLQAQQQQIAAELQNLRAAGKAKSARFKELTSYKMINQSTVNLFESLGL